jgi:Homeodomain-like domain
LAKKYSVRLTEEERTDLESLIHKDKVAANKRRHAEILLKADISELREKLLDSQISDAFGISTRTVERVRERWVQEVSESALNRAKSIRVKSRSIDGEKGSASARVSLRRCALLTQSLDTEMAWSE